jgi:hypothetical protein
MLMSQGRPGWSSHYGNQYGSFSKAELSYDPAILLLGIYPKESKSAYNRDICITMFSIALFTVAKLWNQHRYPSTDE